MPLILQVAFQKFFDDKALSSKPEKNILFYELTITQAGRRVLGIIFKRDATEKTLTLYGTNELKEADNMDVTVGVLPTNNVRLQDIDIHLYKYCSHFGRVGMLRHITEHTSKIQDMCLQNKEKYIRVLQDSITKTTYQDVDKIRFQLETGDSIVAIMRRSFYHTCYTATNNEIQRLCLERLLLFINKHSRTMFTDEAHFLTTFSKFYCTHFVRYHLDYEFARPTVTSDEGDVALESSVEGDCEDFSHMLMRSVRLLTQVAVGTPMEQWTERLRTRYNMYIFLCNVVMDNGKTCYHCSVLFMTKDSHQPGINMDSTFSDHIFMVNDINSMKRFNSRYPGQYIILDHLGYQHFGSKRVIQY